MWKYKIAFKENKKLNKAKWGLYVLKSEKFLTESEMVEELSRIFKGFKDIVILNFTILSSARKPLKRSYGNSGKGKKYPMPKTHSYRKQRARA